MTTTDTANERSSKQSSRELVSDVSHPTKIDGLALLLTSWPAGLQAPTNSIDRYFGEMSTVQAIIGGYGWGPSISCLVLSRCCG